MVTHHQRAVLLNLTQQLAALMSECGVNNLAFRADETESATILAAILIPISPAPSYLKLSGETWSELSTLPPTIPATPHSQDSTTGTCKPPLTPGVNIREF